MVSAASSRTNVSTALVHAAESPMADVLRTCARIASSEATVLITGETGTGKEVFARTIHERSPRATKPFVPVNCGAIPEALLESELFGHVRGAFTGATGTRKGRVALAEGGTLFLDEIGELPLSLQVKLLRLLQEKTYEPVGSADSVEANFRLIAATNRDLAAEVEAGRFRRDLYYRLMVCPLELPALRMRRCDVKPLFQYFWQGRGETRSVDDAVFRALEAYTWPGNVRELENLVERVSVCVDGRTIRLMDLPREFRSPRPTDKTSVAMPESVTEETPLDLSDAPTSPGIALVEPHLTPEVSPPLPSTSASTASAINLPTTLPSLLQSIEDAYIDAALRQANGNKKAAADLLGLQRTTLVEKLRRRQRTASAA